MTREPNERWIQPRALSTHIEVAALSEAKGAFPVRPRVRSEVEASLPAVKQFEAQPTADQQRGQTPDESLAKRVTVSLRGHTARGRGEACRFRASGSARSAS